MRYQRTWRGLRVLGGDAVAAIAPGGAVREVTWNRGLKNLAPATRASITKEAALATGRAHTQACLLYT